MKTFVTTAIASLGLATSVTFPAQGASIAITEFINDVTVDETNDEWVEFFNHGATSVNLLNYTLTDDGSDTYTFGSVTIPSGGFIILAENKSDFETDWLGGTPDSRVIDAAGGIGSLANGADELILSNDLAVEIWRLAYDNDESTGIATFLTGNDFSFANFGSDADPGIVRSGLDDVGILGYESNNVTTDTFAFSSLNGDTGSPLLGQYTAEAAVPEPGSVSLLAIAALIIAGLRQKRRVA